MSAYRIFASLDEANRVLPINHPKKLMVHGRSFCLVRTPDGIFATDNLCPHNKASLSGGSINAYNEIICPLHEYRFNLRTGRESSHRCHDLQTYEIEVGDEGVTLIT